MAIIVLSVLVAETEFQGLRVATLSPDTAGSAMMM